MTGEIQIRVRYAETDRMGLLAPCELFGLLRAGPHGVAREPSRRRIRNWRTRAIILVIAKVEIKYKSPAHYDDVLTIRTTVTRTTPVRIEHRYEVFREGT